MPGKSGAQFLRFGRGQGTDMQLKQRDRYIQNIFTTVAPHLDMLTSGFSFGLDHVWRTRAVSRSGIREGEQVLDVCTGTGKLAFLLSRRVGPRGSVTGADFCKEMIELAKIKAGTRYSNVSFVYSDAQNVPFPDNSFDAVTVAFGIRNIPDTEAALREFKRVLKPGGKFICLELTKPRPGWFRALYEWYTFKIMPAIALLVMKKGKPYVYLPRSINTFHSPEDFSRLITACGYSDITIHPMTMGIATITRAIKQ
jgi:demethylmenaquinone methyltransferase/2-methoxy-6-polyprenyl-1,4-benzoquinol methylase